jgi:uncharacterized membrane protein YfcA
VTLWQGAVIFVAAFIAGMMNSVAGGGTLLSFPALIWIGIAPITANATNTVALWPGSLAGMVGFRREMGDARRWMLLLGAPSVVGAAVGAVLLLRTPTETFTLLVPYLVLLATVLFASQEPLRRLLRISTPEQGDAPRCTWWIGAIFFQFCVAVYGGYFGAGIGILMLAALGLLGMTDIHQMNALKNFLALCINGCAAAYFVLAGAVSWRHALVMTAGAVAGGFGGAGLARRLGRTVVRRAVVAVGLLMAISLFYRH